MRHQLRTYAQRLLRAPVETGQFQPATALQPLIGPNGALLWTDQRLGALAARRDQGLAVEPPARSQPRYTANVVTGWLRALETWWRNSPQGPPSSMSATATARGGT
jgi:hypothetical protein